MNSTNDAMKENPVVSQRRVGRLLAVVVLMMMSGGLGALGAIAWEEYAVHQPRVLAETPAHAGGASVTAHGAIGATPFSATANRHTRGFDFNLEIGRQKSDDKG